MKLIKIITILLLFLPCLYGQAQSPVVDIAERNLPDDFTGYYLKDNNGLFNPYVGRWTYAEGNTSLTLEFKIVEQYFNGEWYEDILVGDYSYTENGVVVVDFLNRLNSPLVNNAQHYIDSFQVIYPKEFVICQDCEPLEKRILCFFSDPDRRYLSNRISLRYIKEDGIEKLQVHLKRTPGASLVLSDDDARETRVPYGDYELIKR